MKWLVGILLFGGFGLLPLWVAIVGVVQGAEGRPATSEYWAAAPWFIVMAVPASAITLGMAGVPWAVYASMRGEHARRLKWAVGAFVATCALVALVAAGVMWRMRGTEDDREYLEQAAEQLVLRDPRVTAHAGADARASVLGWGTTRGSSAIEFKVYVSGETPVHARVRASSGDRDARLSLVCMSLTSFAATPGDKLPCKDPL